MSLHDCGSRTEKTSHQLVSGKKCVFELDEFRDLTFSHLIKKGGLMHDCVAGGTGPTSDTGWGCMLRCGQMILGEALVCRHVGRGKTT